MSEPGNGSKDSPLWLRPILPWALAALMGVYSGYVRLSATAENNFAAFAERLRTLEATVPLLRHDIEANRAERDQEIRTLDEQISRNTARLDNLEHMTDRILNYSHDVRFNELKRK